MPVTLYFLACGNDKNGNGKNGKNGNGRRNGIFSVTKKVTFAVMVHVTGQKVTKNVKIDFFLKYGHIQ